jgi:hypothetical protein
VMVHELVESLMVRRDGVHEAAVNAFDHDHRGRVRRTLKAPNRSLPELALKGCMPFSRPTR